MPKSTGDKLGDTPRLHQTKRAERFLGLPSPTETVAEARRGLEEWMQQRAAEEGLPPLHDRLVTRN